MPVPDRYRMAARAAGRINYAIKRGILTRPAECEECAATDVEIQAAHYDYGRPLDVRWLCRSCHGRWDHAAPKTDRALPSDPLLTTVKVTKTTRRLLRLLAIAQDEPMQSVLERLLRDEVAYLKKIGKLP